MADIPQDDVDRIARVQRQLLRRPNDQLQQRLDEYRTEVAKQAAVAELVEVHADELSTLQEQKTADLADAVIAATPVDAETGPSV